MSLLSALGRFLSLENFRQLGAFDPAVPIETQIARATRQTQPLWTTPTVSDALGVPAILRAVTLISNVTGSLTMQGYRNGVAMPDAPQILARPDPWQRPQETYRDMAYLLATRGEVVLCIMSRDGDNRALAVVVVPPAELRVQDNPDNRLLPTYTWGTITDSRYSTANPDGRFVHITYLREPGALRGVGPLQLAGAAVSVSHEAQEWAANFFAEGGYPSTVIRMTDPLGEGVDANGLTEGDRVRAQWVGRPNNVPRVIDDDIKDILQFAPNPQGAQMLDAREHQNGDAARMFGIPGVLLEFAQAGTSLTYQNLAEVWTNFVRGCLSPNYLEPIEQAMSDLLPNTTAARFNIEGLLRADIKTRADVYNTLIPLGVMSTQQAQASEGWAPGNVEYASVKPSPPQAVPTQIPRALGGEVRCDGRMIKRRQGIANVETCNRLLSTTGLFVGTCPRCGKQYLVA